MQWLSLAILELVSKLTTSRSTVYPPSLQQCGDFPHGSRAPLPSKEAMSAFIGKGGNGVVSYVYYNGKEFAVKEVYCCCCCLLVSLCVVDLFTSHRPVCVMMN